MQELKRGSFLKQGFLASAATVLVAMTAPSAAAQALDEDLWIEASGFFPSIETQVTVSGPNTPGTEIDLEGDLGLDDGQALPAVYAGWKFGDRWQLTGEFYGLDRDATRTITRDIVFDGQTYTLGTSIHSALKSDVFRVTLGYAFIQEDTVEIGAAIGLHTTDFEVSLEGPSAIVQRRRDFIAPLPTVGLYGTYEPMDKVVLNGRVDFLSLDFDDFSGGITNAQASIAYRFTPNFSAGASYRYVSYDFKVNKSEYNADVDYEFSGPSLFARLGF